MVRKIKRTRVVDTMFCQICNESIKEASGLEHSTKNHNFDLRYGQILKKGEKPRKSLIDLNR